MEPYSYKSNGRQLGNAAAAAAICGITWESYQWYVRTGRPASNPAPAHVKVDDKTEQRMYDLKQVRAWQASRKGRGNWGGEGARAREKFRQGPGAAVDADGNPIERPADSVDTTEQQDHAEEAAAVEVYADTPAETADADA